MKTGSDLAGGRVRYLLDRLAADIARGRFERSLSGITAVSALITGGEVYFEHDRASFGKSVMWFPIVLTPFMIAAGVGGIVSKRFAKTALPAVSAVSFATGFAGTYFHMRGIAQRPGGWGAKFAKYNIEMGPPLFAALLFSMVGGMGIASAILRRED